MPKSSLTLLFLLSFISLPSYACQIISSDAQDEFYIDRTCQLNLTSSSKTKPYSTYFVQFIYANNFDQYAHIKENTLKKITVPIATQPYNDGFRVFAGPFNLSDAKSVRSDFIKMGYTDSIIKAYTPDIPPKIKEKTPKQSKPKHKKQTPQKPIATPTMTPVYSLGGDLALLPTYEPSYKGKVTQYNNNYIGSYTYQQAVSVCKAVGRVATLKEYKVMLSNLDFMLDFGAKSQFWLNSTQTVTRIQNKVAPRTQKSSSHFNVICIAK